MKQMKSHAGVFTAAVLGLAMAAGTASAMPDHNDYTNDNLGAMFRAAACTKDGYRVDVNISVNPSPRDIMNNGIPLERLIQEAVDKQWIDWNEAKKTNPAAPAPAPDSWKALGTEITMGAFYQLTGYEQLRTDKNLQTRYSNLTAQKASEEEVNALFQRAGATAIHKEVVSLWNEIVAELTVNDFIRPEAPSVPAAPAVPQDGTITLDMQELVGKQTYFSPDMFRVAQAIAPRYQQQIEDISNGVSVFFHHTRPLSDDNEWHPVKGCNTPAP